MSKIKDIQAIAQELFTLIGIHIHDIEIVTDHELQTVVIDIKTPEYGLFSYNYGELLKAINHVLRRLVEQRLKLEERDLGYVLDVNSEQTKRLADLKARVRPVVDTVRLTAASVELEPMSSYERLMVHTFLSHQAEIKTESVGEGFERRVVVKFSPQE